MDFARAIAAVQAAVRADERDRWRVAEARARLAVLERT